MSRRLPALAIFVRYSGCAAPTPPSGRDQASFSRLALRVVRADDEARDCRAGLLPQVVQPAPPLPVAATPAPAGSDSATDATASATAARTRAVITGRPATAATIARLPDRGYADG